jgi:crossover junction endodeoxyribonuclease RusA
MIVLDLGLPPADPLSINRERTMHWAARARQLEPWKVTTFWLAKQANLPAAVAGAAANVTVALPVRGDRRRDPANFYPTVKAIIDGLVLAGVWPDDTPEYVTVHEPILWHEDHAEIRLELRAAA